MSRSTSAWDAPSSSWSSMIDSSALRSADAAAGGQQRQRHEQRECAGEVSCHSKVQPARGRESRAPAAADDGSTLPAVSPPFRHRIRVRYSECDLQGVVFNANYLTYLDEAMTELFRTALDGGYQAMVDAGVDMVVAESTLRYLAPARFDDEIEVEATSPGSARPG